MNKLVAATALTLIASSAFAGEAPIVPMSGAEVPTSMASSGYAGPVAEPVADPREVISQRYGLLPFFRKGLFGKSNYGACESCEGEGLAKRLGRGGLLGHGGGGLFGHGGSAGGGGGQPGQGVPGVPQAGQPGGGMPGTLVFPYNPFIRSPRDYFMYETK